MKPFLSGRSQVPSANLQPLASANAAEIVAQASATHKHGKSAGGAGPHVETIKQGDKIVRLVVTCSCGERIEIDCLYPVGS